MNNQNELSRDNRYSTPAGREERKRKSEKVLRLLRFCMIVVGAAIILSGLCMLVMPMFRVKTVEVEFGSETHYYTEEEIIEASGIRAGKDGEDFFGIDLDAVIKKLRAEKPYLKSITVKSVFPSKVKITVTEKENIMTAESNGEIITLDRNFTVLAKRSGETERSPFLRITLPAIASASVGSRIVFQNADADTEYILSFLDELKDLGLYPYLTAVDVSQRYAMSVVLSGKCRVELGEREKLAEKLELAGKILDEKGGIGAAFAVVDVSDPAKPTYRTVEKSEL